MSQTASEFAGVERMRSSRSEEGGGGIGFGGAARRDGSVALKERRQLILQGREKDGNKRRGGERESGGKAARVWAVAQDGPRAGSSRDDGFLSAPELSGQRVLCLVAWPLAYNVHRQYKLSDAFS